MLIRLSLSVLFYCPSLVKMAVFTFLRIILALIENLKTQNSRIFSVAKVLKVHILFALAKPVAPLPLESRRIHHSRESRAVSMLVWKVAPSPSCSGKSGNS